MSDSKPSIQELHKKAQEPKPDQPEEEDNEQRMDKPGQPDYQLTALLQHSPICKKS
ncbi:hypothetical protein PGT21_021266 [Puccinia graminis f. sp. tritici]|uniref:Uncharacterized protein n=1 Tax=Puccinia graminis f. sp. tritici TaxID=56615 RepID=A0A5B0NTB7_PUCGR|nr:hypothetical protein PGT21_021266 [Puccinia graminis f. sp. tritici]KAA1091744.1 hypothetical protein PGTUg99_009428 [Puccinia graminis f. sp. tritici]